MMRFPHVSVINSPRLVRAEELPHSQRHILPLLASPGRLAGAVVAIANILSNRFTYLDRKHSKISGTVLHLIRRSLPAAR